MSNGKIEWQPISYGVVGGDSDTPQIDMVKQRDGSSMWAIRRWRSCLNRLGEWEYESLPSSRTDEFLERCRYKTLEEAKAAYEEFSNKPDKETP